MWGRVFVHENIYLWIILNLFRSYSKAEAALVFWRNKQNKSPNVITVYCVTKIL